MNEQDSVLLVIFNRPEKTHRVIDALRQVKPARLFVAADAPRFDHPEDKEKCCLARQVATDVDWPCDVKTRFLNDNVGCDSSVASAIGWFFEHVEYGVIFEDDCVPHPHFFPFCAELFDRYAADERIMQISGLAPYTARNHPYDYHFSGRFRCGGGWGTWQRAWKYFTFSLKQYDEGEVLEMLRPYYADYAQRRLQYMKFCQFKKGTFNNWDFLWNMACYSQNGLSIVPEKNLITNIGFGEDATHTQKVEPIFANLEGRPLKFPLRHPPFVYADGRPERSLEKGIHRSLSLKSRCAQRVKHAFGMMTDFFETMP